jgi:hypothetical protein
VTLLAVLERLNHAGVRLAVNDTGRLHTSAPPGAVTQELAGLIRRHHDLLVWTVVGRRTGHHWVPCDRCGQSVVLHPPSHSDGNSKQVWPRCYLTPGCQGRHRPPAKE